MRLQVTNSIFLPAPRMYTLSPLNYNKDMMDS